MKSIDNMRIWFNSNLSEIAPKFTGSILNVGSGIDIDHEGRTYNKYFKNASEYKTLDSNPKWKADYLNTVDVPDNSFDCVMCVWVLEHVYDIFGFIKELTRITKRYIILGVPTKFKFHPSPGDYWRFTKMSVNKLLEDDFIINYFKEFDNKADHGGILVVGEKKYNHPQKPDKTPLRTLKNIAG